MHMLFVLQEKHFDTPPEYDLHWIEHPSGWRNEIWPAIHQALDPFAPRAN